MSQTCLENQEKPSQENVNSCGKELMGKLLGYNKNIKEQDPKKRQAFSK
jgi:hypothetical protein